jgi:hypothetical protein
MNRQPVADTEDVINRTQAPGQVTRLRVVHQRVAVGLNAIFVLDGVETEFR